MASSKCIACNSTAFEIKQAEPRGSAFKLYFVQCASCGGVVGAMDYNNIGAMIRKQNAAIKALASRLGASVSLES